MPNALPPDQLTADQRRQEIAQWLALALVRWRQKNAESKVGLGFRGEPSVHANSTLRSPTL